jgi:signal transduction histidine kinase
MNDKLNLWWNGRKLVGKHAALLAIVALLSGPLAYFALGFLLQPAFDSIEQQQVSDQKARVQHSLREMEQRLLNATLDYAVWDDMYDYARTPDKAFEAETLSPVSHINNAIDYRGIVDGKGNVIWSSAVDLASSEPIASESEAMKQMVSDTVFAANANSERSTISYVKTPRGIYLLVTGRIIKSDESGEPRGFMVNGRLLKEKALSEALQVKVKLNSSLSPTVAGAMSAHKDKSLSITGSDAITSHVGVMSRDGQLLTSIDFSTPRSISQAGLEAVRSAGLILFLITIGMIIMLSYGLRAITVRRIQALELYVRNFRTGGHKLSPAMQAGEDEIAELSRQFQALSDKLEEAEEQLRQRSYLQGKADSAAGMLHNVRNALAPIRIMQEKWLAEETLPFRANLIRAAEELADDDIDPARKAALEQFMLSAARQIALTSEGRLAEMEETKETIDQVASILASYNFDTSATSFGENVDLAATIKRELAAVTARESGGFELIVLDDLPAVDANRVQLGQVIGNIFVNADEAMIASGANPKKMTVNVVNCVDHWEVHFTDNGDGISEDNLKKVFQRGYSTRNHKAGGLGMHWSANAMRAMGGAITIDSEGEGWGTTVKLTLRKAAQQEQREAA